MGISPASLWDIECVDGELTVHYSLAQIRHFSQVLGVRPRDLLGIESQAAAITVSELTSIIREHCRSRHLTVKAFEDSSGWSVAQSLEQPERFLHEYSIDGIQDICRELEVDWERLVLGL
jgi:hypothetical protein